MNAKLLALTGRVCARTGLLGTLRALANRIAPSAQILQFHRVLPEPDPYLPAMATEAFTRQMECLKRHFRVLPLVELLEAVERAKVPKDAIAITFDDGYRDNYDHAFPILRQLDLPATFFLATGVISTSSVLWHDRVFRAFALTTEHEIGPIAESTRTHRMEDTSARDTTRDAVLGYLKTLHPLERDRRVEEVLGRLRVQDAPPGERMMLSWDEVRRMADSGFAFGAHTVTHPVLSRLPREEVRTELVASRVEIERRLGTACHVLAYPNGRPADYSAKVKELAGEAGYRWALSTVFGTHPPRGSNGRADAFEIQRMAVAETDPELYVAKLSLYKILA
jgi:peptidoglycan/xylan/chitin deacetylase (PgdA/CDA1 family)